MLRQRPHDTGSRATVHRGTLAVRLVESGTLRAADSMTYRSPVEGRETEITYLAPEGTRVAEGDLLVRLDTTALEAELDHATQALKQAELEARVAGVQSDDAAAALQDATDGEGALRVEEARNALQLAERKVNRLREDFAGLKPLLERGYITREEMDRTGFELEQAEADLRVARKRNEVVSNRRQPREEQKARLQLAEREAERLNAAQQVADARIRVAAFRQLIAGCTLYARRPGLVVYEENISTAPRRRVRVGDRVTPSQGLVTIPDLTRMLVESSVRESDVHGVRGGQTATVSLDAFPGARLTARVLNVGTLAQASADRPNEEKRFGVTLLLDRADVDLRPDMTARMELLLEEKRGVLLLPVNAVGEQGSALVARVAHPWGVETRRVEVGSSNDVEIEIRRGLHEGEQVLLERGVAPGR